jgi:HEAT repeat protein
MLLRYENNVSHRRTDIPFRALGYLNMVYRENRTLVTEAENDGNRPVSGFKIARDAYSVFHAAGDEAHSAQLLRLIDSSPTNDFEDLCEQTIGMLYGDAARFRPHIEENIKRILAKQHDDGGWTSVFYSTTDNNVRFFDPKTHYLVRPDFHEQPADPSNQAMSGLALYTLALAGVPEQHPQVQKAIHYLLPKLKEFGAWLDPTGEASITPFLETKWAIISLSQVYPGPDFQKPAKREERAPMPSSTAARLEWLQGVYDADDVAPIVALLDNPEPLVRTAAAHALGRIARDRTDEKMASAVAPLIRCLSDPDKMVARVAAWALRQTGNSGIGVPEIQAALSNNEAGTRRWAARIFQQHYYHLAKNEQLARSVVGLISDPDPLTRVHAVQSSWRWWEASADLKLRGEIEDALIGRFSPEKEPLVRQNLVQAMYNLMDENEGQLFNNWMTALQEADREKLRRARIEFEEKPLARKMAAAIGNNTDEPLRDGALSVFEHWFLRGGLGNDSEWINFLDRDAAQPLLAAVPLQLKNENPKVRERTLRVAASLRRIGDPGIAAAVLDRLQDSSADVRRLALRVEGVLSPAPFQYPEYYDEFLPGLDKSKTKPKTVKVAYAEPAGGTDQLSGLLGSQYPEARQGALEWLRRVPEARNDAVARLVLRVAERGKDALAISNLDWVGKFVDIEPAVETAAGSPSLSVRRAVVDLLGSPNVALPAATQVSILSRLAGELPVEVLNALSKKPALLKDSSAIAIASGIAGRGQARERVHAADLLAARYKASADPRIAEALRAELHNPSVLVRQRASAALGLPAPAAASGSTDALDFQYFVTNIQPIFLKVRTGGARCYNCHSLESNRALLHLQELGPDGTWTAEQARLNYQSVLKVVNQENPLESRILLHPLAPDAGGDEFHSGGKFWTSKDDPDWRALAEWVQGGSVGLDYAFFKVRVQPILAKKYKDSNNQSCMSCHAEGNPKAADFKLLPPDSEDAIRRNYETALLFVSAGDLNASPFLTKPYNTTQRSIRDVKDRELIKRFVRGSGHDGGKFWWELTDPDFQVISQWIQGVKEH